MYVYIIYNTQRRSKILLVSEKLIKREKFTHGMIAISFLSFKLNTSLFFSFFFFRYLREIRRAKIFITLSRYFYLFFIFPFFFFFNHHSLRLFSPIEKFETTIAKKKDRKNAVIELRICIKYIYIARAVYDIDRMCTCVVDDKCEKI